MQRQIVLSVLNSGTKNESGGHLAILQVHCSFLNSDSFPREKLCENRKLQYSKNPVDMETGEEVGE